MAFNAQNISSSVATKIIGASTTTIEGIKISNTKSSGAVVVDLYIQNIDDETIYYILNNVSIPNGATLFLDGPHVMHDNVNYDLYIVSDSSSGDLSIITN
tara:strand:- start:31 stop:330 length:300 start_codon:yes stop_codon:yes gene_type:complete